MPHFNRQLLINRPAEEVFEFFLIPSNLVAVSPPELHMKLVAGPERLKLGSSITLKGRRWGVPHRIVSDVTAFEPNVMFREQQRQGPFASWMHTHHFEEVSTGTLVRDEIEFEPPGGLLGMMITAKQIEKDLEWIFAYRERKLRELLEAAEEVARPV